MKTLFSLIAALFLIANFVHADKRGVPSANNRTPLQSAVYGGVSADTALKDSSKHSVATGPVTVHGVIYSSGAATTTVFYSSGNPSLSGSEVFRISNDTSTNTSNGTSGSIIMLPYPIRLPNGLTWESIGTTLDSVTVLFYKDAENQN